MFSKLIFVVIGFFYLLSLGTCQILPYYSASKYFYANEATIIVGSGLNTLTLPATFPISTASHRLPFYAVTSASNMKTQLDEFMYFWTEITSFSSSSIDMAIYFLKRTVGTTNTYYGFQVPSNVRFRYLLVLNTFPNKYISVAILMTSLSYNIAAGSSKTISFNLPSLVSPAPLTLSATDTVFIHSLTDITLASNISPLDNSFQINLSFSALNSTDFAVKMNAKYPVTVNQIQIKVFIYNKADFDNLFIKIDYQRITYSNLAIGTASFITLPYTASFTPALTTDIFFGIQGIQLSKYKNTGFQFTISSTGGANYDIKLSNLWSTSTIPRLDLFVLLASQFRCPNLQLLIDVTLKICYNNSCPTSTFKSTQVLGVTGIYVCKACISTCYECIGLANNCTSCYADQNREKVGTSCVPMAGFYEASVDVAAPCDSNCLTCSGSATKCTTCDPSMYLSATNVCVTCSSTYVGCLKCTSVKCTLCESNYALDPNGVSCKPCSSYSAYCLTCNNSKCLSCDTTAGYIPNASGSTCITCATFDPKCVSCTSSGCTGCDTAEGYFLNSASACVTCQSYDTNCLTCDAQSCLTCSNGYFLDSINSCISCQSYNSLCLTCDSSSCLSCSNGNFLTSTGTCQSCSTYGLKCTDCNSTSCITCAQGYTVYQTKCQNLNPICGDGQWVETSEPCDDGNLLDNDGCNSQCQVQQDYQCLFTDKLPSGASLCKYTQNLTVNFNSMEKDISSNKLHVFLNIGPSTFKQLTKDSIMSLISPVQIVDSQTGAVKQIPPQNINLIYHQNLQTGQVQLIIDYGQNNLQDSSLRLNIRPDMTNLNALRDIPPQIDLLMKLNSQSNGFYLYDYPPETYETQSLIQTLSFMVGILSLFFAILGFCMPTGKLIVLQALAVIQIGYFSLLQFDRIPPTFAGLKSLNMCNGFNDLSLFFSSNQIKQNIFKVIGLKTIALSNYNITLVLFVFIPAMIGIIGFLVTKNSQNAEYKKVRRNSTASQDGKNDEITDEPPSPKNQQNEEPSLGRIIFQRILYENTFYGLLFGGYIGWVSILHSFSQPLIFDYVFLGIIMLSSIGYGYLYFRSENKQINLRDSDSKKLSKFRKVKKNGNQDLKISTQFGQFSDVHQQLMPAAQSMFMKRIYLFFMGQRLMNSFILVFLPGILSFTSPVLIGIYLLELIGMIVMYKKFQTDVSVKSKGSICSHIYQNYVLRQSINFLTIILIQALYFYVTLIVQSNGPYEAFVENGLVTKGVPFDILSLLFLNMGFNIFCWVWELKSDRLLLKAKIVLGKLFPNSFLSCLSSKQDLSISISDQEEVDRVMNNFMQNSLIFKCKQSPFLGIQQKQSSKNALLDLIKIEQKTKIQLPESAKNLKSTMINQLWDQI